MQNGIILIMTGNFNYGIMALNLAMSIKRQSRIPICLLTNFKDDACDYINRVSKLDNLNLNAVFDTIKQIPDEYLVNNKVNISLLKISLDKLTPFNNTIYIDIDTALLNLSFVNILIETLDKLELIYQTDGTKNILKTDSIYNNITTWGEYSNALGLTLENGCPQVHSYFFAFKKSKLVSEFFNNCRYFYHKIINTELFKQPFYGSVSDEVVVHLAFINSKKLLKLYSNFIFTPVCDYNYSHHRENIKDFSLITFCGSWTCDMINLYENITSQNLNKIQNSKHRRLRFVLLDNYFSNEFLN